MIYLQKKFDNREQLISYVKKLAPWATGDVGYIEGGRQNAEHSLSKIDPISYSITRNYGDGNITKLSPFIHHGILSLNEVRNHVLSNTCNHKLVYKFIQELGWRDFWQRLITYNPDFVWKDIEPYKTGFTENDYANELPDDIKEAKTGVNCIDEFIKELVSTGYIHNHSRMYLASFIVHFRRIKWQVGARWFLEHLLDGDLASNNLSWQWVASTFSNKPYIFNLENIDKYFGKIIDTSPTKNELINHSYEALQKTLFPNM